MDLGTDLEDFGPLGVVMDPASQMLPRQSQDFDSAENTHNPISPGSSAIIGPPNSQDSCCSGLSTDTPPLPGALPKPGASGTPDDSNGRNER